MSELKIHSALVTAYLASDVMPKARTAFEGRSYEPVTGKSWARLTDMPTARNPAANGRYAPQERRGYLQIDLFHPKHKGAHPILSDADKAFGFFRPGRRFNYEGQGLAIRSTDRSRIVEEDVWQKVSVFVHYTAWTFPLLTDDPDLYYAGGSSLAGSQALPAE